MVLTRRPLLVQQPCPHYPPQWLVAGNSNETIRHIASTLLGSQMYVDLEGRAVTSCKEGAVDMVLGEVVMGTRNP